MDSKLSPTIEIQNQGFGLTTDFELESAIGIGSMPSRLGQPSLSGASRAFDESTRQLLRNRLILAIKLFLGLAIAFTLLSATLRVLGLSQVTVSELSSHVIGLFILSIALVVLTRNPNLSLAQLRRCELLILLVPITELVLVLCAQSSLLVAEGRVAELPILRTLIGMTNCTLITLYGMFIPNPWRRTALVTGVAAVIPSAAIALHGVLDQRLLSPEAIRLDIALPVLLLTIAAACIATLGARVVHQIRRAVEAAKQYGQYELIQLIGEGGMGVVYKARHRMLKRPAAIKLIRPDVGYTDATLAGFEQEVQTSATLSHWNTVQVFDYGKTDKGEFYYVMEFLTGHSLSERLQKDGKLSLEQTREIGLQLCAGLEEAHRQGMIHRDIKPANLFLAEVGGERDVLKILDFGLVVLASDKTRNMTVSGTPSYMSPEQIRGEDLDPRSDIYAIGCVLFECITGKPPFVGEKVSGVFDSHLNESVPIEKLDDTPYQTTLRRCLEKDRSNRFDSVRELAESLKHVS